MFWVKIVESQNREPILTHGYGGYVSKRTTPLGLWAEKWTRRAVTISLYTALFIAVVFLFPFLCTVAFIIGLFQGKPLIIVRVVAFFLSYLLVEMLGLVGALLSFLAAKMFRVSELTWRKWTYTLQYYWGCWGLFGLTHRSLGCKLVTEGLEDVKDGPYLLFMRHASTADTLVPQYIFSDRFRMRYIVKRELLFDPGLDVLGNRSPNFFLLRETRDQAVMDQQLVALSRMVEDLDQGTNVMVVIWPEGTRFTEAKRARIIEKLKESAGKNKQQGTPAQAEHAERLLNNALELKKTLPPRLGGVQTLLENNRAAGVVFCAHVGMEKAGSFWDFARGRMCNTLLKVKFFVVPYDQIPTTRQEREAWLFAYWKKMDAWVADQLGTSSSNTPPHS